MASVWKRLQRVNKRAAKFQYTASYHRIELDTSAKWKPTKLCVAWTRRSRRVVSEPREWEPSLKDPLSGSVLFTVPDNQTVAVTLFKDSRTNELEDKDWTFVLEDISPTGKRRRLAVCPINMRKYASLEPTQRTLQVQLEPTTQKIVRASLQFTLHCVLLREGQATDEDMQSLASLLSVNNNSDIAVLEDLDEDDYTLSDNSTKQLQDFRQQVEEMTQSLTNSDLVSPLSPNSIQSLTYDNSRTVTTPIITNNFDLKTPVAENNEHNFHDSDITLNEKEQQPKNQPEYINTMTKVPLNVETPKFTSTPNKNIIAEINPDPSIKGISYKSDKDLKRNLKLELNSNLNNIRFDKNDSKNEAVEKTPLSEVKKIEKTDRFMMRLEKENTPVLDLLEWCQSVTCEYKSCCVTNLTTSFRSGLAFCAIIHRFRPDLIDFSGLQPDAAESNVRTALEASATLGIPQVLSVADVCTPPSPDRLAIMTYLFQLRAHFTGSELQVEQLGNDETESSYLVGRHDTDGSLAPDLFSREVVTRRSLRMERQQSPLQESQQTKQSQDATPEKASSPTAMKDVKDMFFHQSKTILNKMLSPPSTTTKPSAKWFANNVKANESFPIRPEKLMTRNELNDPFGSDEETETDPTPNNVSNVQQNSDTKSPEPVTTDPLMVAESREKEYQAAEKSMPTPELPKVTPQLLSRHDELKERARLLLEQTKREARDKEKVRRQKEVDKSSKEGNLDTNSEVKKPVTEEERHAILRERARKLIADARAGIVSPTSPLSPSRTQRTGTVEIISKQSVMEEIAAQERIDQAEERLSAKSDSFSSDENTRRSSLQSFTSLIDRLTPDKDDVDIDNEEGPETGSYIQSELEALEREQKAIDETAAALEKQLRAVMESNDNTEEEDRLMSQWFNLVNKKNALLRRQMQLNILEQEEDLSRRCELLARELRLSLGVEEWRKTPGQKRRERLLLQELLAAVNERDRLVQVQDEQEKAIEEDAQIEHNLSQVDFQRDKNNCILQ